MDKNFGTRPETSALALFYEHCLVIRASGVKSFVWIPKFRLNPCWRRWPCPHPQFFFCTYLKKAWTGFPEVSHRSLLYLWVVTHELIFCSRQMTINDVICPFSVHIFGPNQRSMVQRIWTMLQFDIFFLIADEAVISKISDQYVLALINFTYFSMGLLVILSIIPIVSNVRTYAYGWSVMRVSQAVWSALLCKKVKCLSRLFLFGSSHSC